MCGSMLFNNLNLSRETSEIIFPLLGRSQVAYLSSILKAQRTGPTMIYSCGIVSLFLLICSTDVSVETNLNLS